MSQGIGIYTLVQPCCTSRLLWRRGRVSDCHPGDPGSIPVRVRSEDIFLHLSHAHLQYVCNIPPKYQMNILKALGGVDFTKYALSPISQYVQWSKIG